MPHQLRDLSSQSWAENSGATELPEVSDTTGGDRPGSCCKDARCPVTPTVHKMMFVFDYVVKVYWHIFTSVAVIPRERENTAV